MPTMNRRRRSALLVLAASTLITIGAAACEPTVPVNPPGTPSTPTTTTPAITPPATSKVTCPAGGSITVATSISTNVKNLLAAAKGDGLSLCGSGYRDSKQQIELRKENCGTTHYDIYVKPANQCTPPTAIPGTSNHEKGLAIDFHSCSTQSTSCFGWLAKNAATYGLRNLPSEPWHWSTNGRSRTGDHAHPDHDV